MCRLTLPSLLIISYMLGFSYTCALFGNTWHQTIKGRPRRSMCKHMHLFAAIHDMKAVIINYDVPFCSLHFRMIYFKGNTFFLPPRIVDESVHDNSPLVGPWAETEQNTSLGSEPICLILPVPKFIVELRGVNKGFTGHNPYIR